MKIEEFLSYLCSLDIKLWADGDRMRCNAPEGTLTPSLRVQLQERKAEILAFLQKANLGSTTLDPILPVPRFGKLPLSFAQQRLWFLQQLEVNSGFYNIAAAVHFEGQLNVAALEYSLNYIISRHEALRTNFVTVDGQPVQVIHPARCLTLQVVDLQQLSQTEREITCKQLLIKEAVRPFDLALDPLVRASLLQLTQKEHVLLLVMHHIVSDGWSMGVLVRELAAVYQATCNDAPIMLPELPIQYADFAHWQQQWLQGEVLESQLAYWKQQLSGATALLELPTDRPRPAIQTYRGATEKFAISQQLGEALFALSQRQGVTLFMTLLAAFQTLLYRYSGQTDICVGTPIANRNRGETEGLIGLFVNTLVLRGNLSGNPSFSDLLSLVREVALGAYAHQDLPFEQLVEQLQPERSLSYTPLFSVMFVLQNAPMPQLDLTDLTLLPLPVESSTAKFDLTLSLENTDLGLSGFIEYNTDLFDAATIERMAGHYQTLLEAIVANPDQKLSELPLLTATEQDRILVEWNRTSAPYPKHLCLHQLFEQLVDLTPDAVAVVFDTEQLTYSELNARANQLAHHLQALGVEPEVLVGICAERSLSMVVGLLAILKAGGAYVPLDPIYPPERLAYILSDACVSVLLTQQQLLPTLTEYDGRVVYLDLDWHSDHSSSNPNSGVSSDNLAYAIYTSGSTGRPKGVQIRHSAVVNFLSSMSAQPGMVSEDVLVAVTTITFDIAALELFLPLSRGARVVLTRDLIADGGQSTAELATSSATVMQGTPATWRLLMQAGFLGNQQLKILCGGEALDRELAAQLIERAASLWNMYGPTETTIWSAVSLVQAGSGSVSIGGAIANTQFYILDTHLQPVPVGVAGELHIGGDGLARGYLNRPELTAEKFIPNPFGDAGQRLYKTGDLVRYLSDGNIEYLGRIDHQVKVRGFRIELGEIEALLSQHPTVRQAVVIALDIVGDKRLVAYIVPHIEPVPTISELRDELKQQLPEYMVPSYFVVLDAMPLTPNGKVDRSALPAPTAQPEAHNFVAPRTPIEEMLVSIWASLLQLERVGVHDNFFTLGGHSLLATQLMSRLQSTFAVELPLRSLFELPTVAALAEHIATAGQTGQSRQTPIVKVPRQPEMPVSFAQQRLWFLQQFEPESGFYNLTVAVRFQGDLNITALEQSLNYIINRHEALRTNFIKVDGQPMQVIASSMTLKLAVVDLQQLDPTEREITCQQLATAEAVRPFDLALEALMRATLLQLQPTEHVLLLVMHHIVSDGWSMGVLVRELATVYQAVCNDLPIALPELPIQYADFAYWQQQWLQQEVLTLQLAYWKEQLAGAPALLELPTDRPRPAIQTYRGATERFSLSDQLSAALTALSQKQEVTLFMTLLAAFQTLLYRYSGQTDICVGTPIANRNRKETEELIGLFVNTLVLRGNLSGNPSFSDLLLHVREVALGAYAHQDLPFEQLVEQLQPERSLSYTPLFSVMFVLQNAPMPELELPNLTLLPLPIESSTAKFDLTLVLENTSAGLSGLIEYNTDLFDAATIVRMVGHYQTLLEAVVADPGQKLSELPLLTATEQHQILVEWNNTQADYPKQLCLHQLFEQQVQKTPDAVAVVFEDQQLTYGELNVKANQLAHHLRSLGVGPEVLVGICTERSLSMVVGLLAILKAGGAYVPLDPIYPPERLAYILSDARVSLLLTQQAVVDTLPDMHGHVVYLDKDLPICQSSSNPHSGVSADNLAYAIYTSGSTGRPKGVQIRHDAVVNFLSSMSAQPGMVSEDVLVAVTTITFDIAALELFLPLSRGARVVLSRDLIADGGQSTAALATSSATVMQGTPATWRVLMQAGFLGNPQLKILCGGEALSRELATQLLERADSLWNMYGPTETTIWSAVSLVQAGSGSVSIGRAIANTQFYILDANLQPVPVGVAGELHIGGDGLARGYLNRPELTAQKFIPNPFGDAGQRLYKTGDLVRYRIDGNIEYLGRIDNQVKIRGFRMELGEIEAVLSQHKSVQQAVAIATESAGDKRLVAYLVSHTEPAPTISELRDELKQQLPEYMIPSYFVLLDRLPLTPNGKVDRSALPAPTAQPEAHTFVAPRTPTEEMLAGIWATLLAVERVGIYDNFFTLGGHSLLATQLMSRLQSTFAVELPLRSLFELPTVAALAEYIATTREQGLSRQTPPIVRVARQTEMPLSFAQQRLWFLQQLEVDSGFYNLTVAVRFEGQLNVAALESSLNQIVSRHEALRTNFVTVNGQPMQVIASSLTLTLPVVDLQQLSQTERETTCRQLLIEEAARPFNLAVDPLVRASLLLLGETEHILLVVMHHIVSDGWSIGVLVRELAFVYQAQYNNTPIALPELPIQYADFAAWQQQWLQGEVLESQLAYWKQQLSGATALLELPTDRPRPAIQTYRGATEKFAISVELSSALFALSQRLGVTLFMTLLAAFQTLLSRYSGQTDICVGTPIANRNRSETEELIGLFVNTLVLRSNLSGNPSFADFLLQVREVALDAYAYQDLPFEQLVEQLQPQRSLSYTPLFQVMFVLQNAPMPQLDLTDLTLVPLPLDSSTAKFDLTLSLENTERGLNGSIEYNTDLFDAATIERMAGHYQTLLEAIVANPGQKLSELPILSAIEHHQLLVEWNQTQATYPNLCIHQLFEQQVHLTPDAVAVVFEDEQLTYRELNAKANQLGHHLQTLGVGPEVLVGICTERSLSMVVGLLAILKAGGAYVPLDPIYPPERLAYIIEDARVSVLLAQKHLVQKLDYKLGDVVYLDRDWDSNHSSENLRSSVSSDNLAYAIYTSGSTGRPKGVQIRHSAVVNFLTSMSRQPGLVSSDVLVAVTTITFDIAALELFGPLTIGARVVVSREVVADGGQQTAELATSSATVMQGTPATWRLLTSAGFPGNPQLKILCGGEALPRELASQLLERAATLWNMYGPTETTIWSAVSLVQPGSGSVSIGKAIANTQFYILDANLQPVPVGVPGELHIGGDGLARGYLNRPELTAEKFIPNPFGVAGTKLYKTGDLVRYLSDGNIEYLCRQDHQVKIRGFRMELGEIEALLSQHKSVQLSVVIAKEILGDKRLVAYIVPHTEPAPTISELRDFLKQQLPEYMVPAYFVVLDRLPLTPNGKVDRSALPTPTAQPDSHNFVAPRTPTEEMLAGIWAKLLGVERVGIYDNFFELGGDSILTIQVVALANQAGLQLTVKQLFEHQTIAQLAAACTTTALQAEQNVVTGTLPLTPIQHWFFEQNSPEPAHWNQALLLEQPDIDPNILEQVVQQLLVHHDALRLRFERTNSGWLQKNAAVDDSVPFTQIDLSTLPEAQHKAAIEALGAELQTSLNLSNGPVVRVAWLFLGDRLPSRLLIVIHHLAVDVVSWRILLEDLQTAYQQLSGGAAIQLPAKTTAFKHWAQRLAEYAQSQALEKELGYWLTESYEQVASIPIDYPPGANTEASARTVSVSLSVEETRALLEEVPKAYNTQIDDVLLTALVQVLAQWTGSNSILLNLEGHGREDIFENVDISRTVGWFTTIKPVVLELQATDNPGETLKSVKEQLRRVPQQGIGYGLLRYLKGDAEIAAKLEALPQAQVSFNYLGQFDQLHYTIVKVISEFTESNRSPIANRSHLLDVSGLIIGGQLRLDWTFSEKVHLSSTVESLAHKFLQALQGLIAHCLSAEAGGYTPSDFSVADLSQTDLDELIAQLQQEDIDN